MHVYGTIRNAIAVMLVTAILNLPSLATNSNEYAGAENQVCSQHPSQFGCLSTKSVLLRFTCYCCPIKMH